MAGLPQITTPVHQDTTPVHQESFAATVQGGAIGAPVAILSTAIVAHYVKWFTPVELSAAAALVTALFNAAWGYILKRYNAPKG